MKEKQIKEKKKEIKLGPLFWFFYILIGASLSVIVSEKFSTTILVFLAYFFIVGLLMNLIELIFNLRFLFQIGDEWVHEDDLTFKEAWDKEMIAGMTDGIGENFIAGAMQAGNSEQCSNCTETTHKKYGFWDSLNGDGLNELDECWGNCILQNSLDVSKKVFADNPICSPIEDWDAATTRILNAKTADELTDAIVEIEIENTVRNDGFSKKCATLLWNETKKACKNCAKTAFNKYGAGNKSLINYDGDNCWTDCYINNIETVNNNVNTQDSSCLNI